MKLRLSLVALLLLLVVASPSPARGASCALIASSYNGAGFQFLDFGPPYAGDADIAWRGGNYQNYSVLIASAGSSVGIGYYNTSNTWGGNLVTGLTIGSAPFVIVPATAALTVISTEEFTGYVCPAGLGTATPLPPTSTAVMVTVTPSPVPTPDSSIALQERADQTFSLQIFGFSVMIGLAVWAFFRRR